MNRRHAQVVGSLLVVFAASACRDPVAPPPAAAPDPPHVVDAAPPPAPLRKVAPPEEAGAPPPGTAEEADVDIVKWLPWTPAQVRATWKKGLHFTYARDSIVGLEKDHHLVQELAVLDCNDAGCLVDAGTGRGNIPMKYSHALPFAMFAEGVSRPPLQWTPSDCTVLGQQRACLTYLHESRSPLMLERVRIVVLRDAPIVVNGFIGHVEDGVERPMVAMTLTATNAL